MDYVDLLPFIHRYGHKINMGAQYQVIDNFLPTYQFKTLESLIMTSEKFPWYFVNNTVSLENPHYNVKDFQFVHAFYSGGKITSQFFSDFEFSRHSCRT